MEIFDGYSHKLGSLPFSSSPDILAKLRDIRQDCARNRDSGNGALAWQYTSDFSVSFHKYLSIPAVQARLREEEDRVREEYGPEARPPIKKDHAKIHFHGPEERQRVVKISNLNYDHSHTIDDPVLEARWCHMASKDNNPTMLPCIESFALGNRYFSVTPTATMGSLLDYLRDPQSDKTQLKSMFADLLSAMSYLHNHMRVAHLDLKPDNVFLGKHNQVIVGDFGVALAVANEQRETAQQSMLQKLESKLQRRGASAQEIEQRKQREVAKFDALYDQYEQMQGSLSAILRASHQSVNRLLAHLPPLTVPLKSFFRSSSQQQGFTYEKILSINGYTDPNDPQMFGNRLVDSFLAYLRRQYPNEADQKHAIANFTVRLMPNLPAKFYEVVKESDVPAAPIQGYRGTAQYMCPALANGDLTNPFAADVYSLGVVLFIVATGFQPYKSVTERAFYELQRGGVEHLLRCYGETRAVHPTCLALLKRMMHFDPARRPTIDECISEFRGVTLLPFVPRP